MLPLFLKVPAAQAALDVKTVPLILYAGIFSSVLLSFLWIEACIGWAQLSSTCCRCSPPWLRLRA